jgi:molybdate transport system substrate-binding protein
MLLRRTVLAAAVALMSGSAARAAETHIAVAANFAEAAREIARQFEQSTGHKAVLSFGATGQFYAQITQGAPFQVFLSADQATPKRLVDEGRATGVFTYAIGKLVLYSRTPGLVTGEQTLRDARFARIAIANPATAPYGAAGVEVMKTLGVHQALAPKIVQGNNIAQTFQFVDTRNAEVGFVALSQVIGKQDGSQWVVAQNLYTPIRQDAVLLRTGNQAANAFLAFLKGPEAAKVIETFGYATE